MSKKVPSLLVIVRVWLAKRSGNRSSHKQLPPYASLVAGSGVLIYVYAFFRKGIYFNIPTATTIIAYSCYIRICMQWANFYFTLAHYFELILDNFECTCTALSLALSTLLMHDVSPASRSDSNELCKYAIIINNST